MANGTTLCAMCSAVEPHRHNFLVSGDSGGESISASISGCTGVKEVAGEGLVTLLSSILINGTPGVYSRSETSPVETFKNAALSNSSSFLSGSSSTAVCTIPTPESPETESSTGSWMATLPSSCDVEASFTPSGGGQGGQGGSASQSSLGPSAKSCFMALAFFSAFCTTLLFTESLVLKLLLFII